MCRHGCLLSIFFLLLSAGAEAQVKRLECAPPRGVSRSGEVATLIADGESDCSRGSAILEESKQWHEISDDLRKQADRYRKDADRNRKEAVQLRDEVRDFRFR